SSFSTTSPSQQEYLGGEDRDIDVGLHHGRGVEALTGNCRGPSVTGKESRLQPVDETGNIGFSQETA
ncbi:MAG: hypothetical protein ACE5I2_13195, partial [Anaerolineae bacterium]